MSTLGGTLFVHDAIRLDYCIEAAIESLVPVCDEVLVMDCQSTDGTLELLQRIARQHRNVEIIRDQPWEVGTNYDRLMIHANAVRERLTARWHFMLQADEVLHEWSYGTLREAVANNGWGSSTFRVRRFNLYGDFGRCVSLASGIKPCSDEPTRLALANYPAVRDAETIGEPDGMDERLIPHVTLLHYGFVRRGGALIDKAIEMQRWFNGPEGTVDPRVLKMREEGNGFRYAEIMPDSELMPLPVQHPAAAIPWLREHGA